MIAPGETVVWRLRLSDARPTAAATRSRDFDATFAARHREADEFYAVDHSRRRRRRTRRNVMRQALAGMLWSKQYYYLDASRWLGEHGVEPFCDVAGRQPRNDDGRTWSTPT